MFSPSPSPFGSATTGDSNQFYPPPYATISQTVGGESAQCIFLLRDRRRRRRRRKGGK